MSGQFLQPVIAIAEDKSEDAEQEHEHGSDKGIGPIQVHGDSILRRDSPLLTRRRGTLDDPSLRLRAGS